MTFACGDLQSTVVYVDDCACTCRNTERALLSKSPDVDTDANFALSSYMSSQLCLEYDCHGSDQARLVQKNSLTDNLLG